MYMLNKKQKKQKKQIHINFNGEFKNCENCPKYLFGMDEISSPS